MSTLKRDKGRWFVVGHDARTDPFEVRVEQYHLGFGHKKAVT